MNEPGRFKIVLTKTARREFKKLDPRVKTHISTQVESKRTDPLHSAIDLRNPNLAKFAKYRWSIGKVRVLFDIDHQKRIVTIKRISFRRESYE